MTGIWRSLRPMGIGAIASLAVLAMSAYAAPIYLGSLVSPTETAALIELGPDPLGPWQAWASVRPEPGEGKAGLGIVVYIHRPEAVAMVESASVTLETADGARVSDLQARGSAWWAEIDQLAVGRLETLRLTADTYGGRKYSNAWHIAAQ